MVVKSRAKRAAIKKEMNYNQSLNKEISNLPKQESLALTAVSGEDLKIAEDHDSDRLN